MSAKGKGRLETAISDMVDATSDSVSVSQLLNTPEPFNINDISDVDKEIDRLEGLAADYHWINSSKRFLTRFSRLTSQKEKLEHERDRHNPSSPDLMDALEAYINQEEQASHKKKPQLQKKPTMTLHANPATRNLTDREISPGFPEQIG